MTSAAIRFCAPVFRAHNPEWAWDPVSGEGARRHGGRFNPPGLAALYTALSPLTAIREASAFGRPMEPLTLCEYEVDCADILDTTDPAACAAEAVVASDLACPDWARRMYDGRPVPSQELARHLIARGYAGIVVPSFARGAGPADRNLVFWDWGAELPHRVRVIDSQNRLPRDRASWS